MFARIATFECPDLDGLDAVVRWQHEHDDDPADPAFPDYRGSIMLLDRGARRVTNIHVFDSEATARAADETLDRGLPDDAPDEVRNFVARTRRTERAIVEMIAADGRLAELA